MPCADQLLCNHVKKRLKANQSVWSFRPWCLWPRGFFMTESIADLLLISIAIPPRDVEHLLDALARLPYSINADLKYEEWQTTVEFPAYRSWLPNVRGVLASRGFNAARLKYSQPVMSLQSAL